MTVTETDARPKAAFEFKRFTPEGFDGPPETPLEALLQAQAVLLDEERWVKSKWYSNNHPEVDPEDPFCNNWKVCAAGAVMMVTVGAARQLSKVQYDYDLQKLVTEPVEGPGLWCPVWPDLNGAMGPVRADNPEYNIYDEAVEFLRLGATGIAKRGAWTDVPAFNDNPFTTRTDVLKAFSKGIALAAKAEAEATIAEHVSVAEDELRERIRTQLNNALAVA